MKRLIILLLLLSPVQSWGRTVVVVGGGAPVAAVNECEGKIICQNFEGTGYDNSETWTESGSTVDEDYTSVVLRGSQSLLLDNAASGSPSITLDYAGVDTMWTFMRVRFPGALPGGNCLLAAGRGNTSGDPVTLWEFYYRPGSSGFTFEPVSGTQMVFSTSVTADTTYFIWLKWVRNSVANLYVSTSATRPSPVGSDTAHTRDFPSIGLKLQVGNTVDAVYDQVLVDDAEISDVQS